MPIFDFAVFRQLEKLSDLFEKLRVRAEYLATQRDAFANICPDFVNHCFCLCAPAESRGKGSVGPGAKTHRVAEVLHERHPSCQGES